ncbi:cytochrome c [bacterium]|nr:cytochrome c [bacterium]
MKKLITVALILVGGLFLLDVILGQDPHRRNLDFSPDMAMSVAYKAESPNPHFANGQTQQNPVSGTIARGFKPLHFGGTVEESVRAGQELANPFDEPTARELERGKNMYEIYCQVCHGAGGQGNGPVTRRGYPPPASLLLDNARNMKDGQIFHIITYGYKNMPAYAGQLERDDRWLTIAHVRKLQEPQP